MTKTAIFLADGFEEIEGLTVVDLLRRAGIDIHMVSVTGKNKVTGAHNITIETEQLIEELNFDVISMLILPGGMPGTKNLESCELLKKHLLDFNLKDKYIAAICAAPSVLGHLEILNGKRACCYKGFEKDLYGANICEEPSVIDGNIITGRGAGCAISFALAIIEKIKGKNAANQIADSIIF